MARVVKHSGQYNLAHASHRCLLPSLAPFSPAAARSSEGNTTHLDLWTRGGVAGAAKALLEKTTWPSSICDRKAFVESMRHLLVIICSRTYAGSRARYNGHQFWNASTDFWSKPGKVDPDSHGLWNSPQSSLTVECQHGGQGCRFEAGQRKRSWKRENLDWCHSLLGDLQRLLNDRESSDVVFVVGKEEASVFAHRLLLVARCLTLSPPRVINFKFPLQPHQKYYIT